MLKISIITAVYNSESTIAMTMESILSQTYANIEYIVIDGASSDNTLRIVKQYEKLFNGKMHWVSEPDYGIYDAMNKGLTKASGEIIGFLNADDFYTSNSVLENIANAFQANKEIDGIYGDVHFVNPNNLDKMIRLYSAKSFTRSKMRFGFMPPHPSVYIKKDIYNRLGGYNIRYKIAADFDLLLRYIYIHQINIKYINMDFVTMRIGGISTSSWAHRITIMHEHLQIFRDHNIRNNAILLSIRYLYKIKEFLPNR